MYKIATMILKKEKLVSVKQNKNLENIHPYVHEYVIYNKMVFYSVGKLLAKNNGYCESGIDICRR